MKDRKLYIQLEEIFQSGGDDLHKLVQAFDLITTDYISHGENEIEIFQALKDEDNLIKERIKTGMMKTARGIFNYCVRNITGEPAWEGEEHEL